MPYGGYRPWLKNYAPGVRYKSDYPVIPLYGMLDKAVANYPDYPALIYKGRNLTYRQLGEQADRIAGFLVNLGIKKGDRVAIMLPNSPELVAAFYSILKAGAAVVFINPSLNDFEFEYKLSNSGSETIFILDSYCEHLKRTGNSAIKNVVLAGTNAVSGNTRPGEYFFSDILNQTWPACSFPQINPPADPALIQYTGGTTGVSKGVVLTHYNLVANALQAGAMFAGFLPHGGRILAALPLSHIYGVTLVMDLAAAVAGSIVILPRFEAEAALAATSGHKPDLFPGTPDMFAAVLRHPGLPNYDVSSIKAGISIAAPLPGKVAEKFEQVTGGRLVEGYGLTEASPMIAVNPASGESRPGSIGQPLPDTECAIVNLDMGEKELPPGEIGELIIRGPQVMKGYWNRPDETRHALRGSWLFTGDVAKIDQDGYIFVVNRKKNIINTSCFSVFPRDVEDVLYEHPKITEAVVLGVSDLYGIEYVKAYVVLKEGETATGAEIIQFCSEHLAEYKVPKEIEFRHCLPKTIVGKVLRRVLLEEEKNRQAGLLENQSGAQ